MGCGYGFIFFLFLLILCTIQLGFNSEGRPNPKFYNFDKAVNEEDKMVLRAQIGSRPPRCERRCSSCSHCEAIQVPTNSQVRSRKGNFAHFSNVAYARGDDYSNYKPLSWKCKCGNHIFNP
ncbi:hypothetical protein SLE2022_363930 [Rubroshorea leprosula]